MKYGPLADGLRDALVKRGHRVEYIPPERFSAYDGFIVNVWRDPLARYPDYTVYIDPDGYTWGDNYQHTAPHGTSHNDVADRILATSGYVHDGAPEATR